MVLEKCAKTGQKKREGKPEINDYASLICLIGEFENITVTKLSASIKVHVPRTLRYEHLRKYELHYIPLEIIYLF